MPIFRLFWAVITSRTDRSTRNEFRACTADVSAVIALIMDLFHHISKTPSAHHKPCHKTRPLFITFATMPPDPRRDSQRNYIRVADHQIAHTPRTAPQEFPGSFQENKPDYTERPVKNVAHPATNKPKDDDFFAYDRNGAPIPNLDFTREHFLGEGRLNEQQAIHILDKATDLLSREPNLLPVPSPVTGEPPILSTRATISR